MIYCGVGSLSLVALAPVGIGVGNAHTNRVGRVATLRRIRVGIVQIRCLTQAESTEA